MINPITATVNWLIKHPLVSHAVVSSLEAVAVTFALRLIGLQYAPILAAVLVSTFYYGREAGQHEHDLKNAGTSPFWAFAGSEFGFLWSLDNLVQWLAAAGATAAVAAALTFAGL